MTWKVARLRFVFLGVPALIALAAPAASQVPQGWYDLYQGFGGNGYDEANAIAVDAAGNVYVAGQSGTLPSGPSCCNGDFVTIKYDANGNRLWVRRYDNGGHDQANSIAVDQAGNVYVSGPSQGGATGYDIATVKYDANGNQQWVQRYNGPGNGDDWSYNHSLAVDRFGGVYVCGESPGVGTGLDFVTIKYDAATGNRLWASRYNGPGGTTDRGKALVLDPFGNVYVTGYSNAGGDFTADFALVKYNSSGVQQWVARTNFINQSHDRPYDLAIDRKGNVFVTGGTYPAAQDGKPDNFCGSDLLTVKYSPTGQQLWAQSYNGPGNCDDYNPVIAVDRSGNAYVAGISYGSGPAGTDVVLLKYDGTAGSQLWQQRFTSPSGVSNPNDSVSAIALDFFGDVYLACTSAGVGTDFDLVTLKYNSSGYLQYQSRFNIPTASRDFANAIAVDKSRNFYVAGSTYLGPTNDIDWLVVKNAVNTKEPGPAFTWTPGKPVKGQPAQFLDQSGGATPLSWAWDFNGDGLTDSTLQNPSHVFANAGAYEVTLTVTNSYGTASLTQTVVVDSNDNNPYVESVFRDYEGFFLQGTDVKNKFRANINWKGAPGTAAFQANFGAAVVEPGDAGGATHEYDMKTAFPPGFSASTVVITPTNGEDPPVVGNPRTESVWVFPYPNWLSEALEFDPGALKIEAGGGEVKASIEKEFPKPHIQTLFVFPQSVPYIGGDFGVTETFAKISGSVSSTGVGSLTLSGQTGFKALGGGVTGSLSGSGNFRLFPPDGLILQKASLTLGIAGQISRKEGFLDAIPQLAALEAVPVIGSAINWLNDHATLTGEIDPSLKFTASFAQKGGALEFQEGTGTLGLDLKATIEIKVTDELSAKGWVAGGGSFTAGVPVTDQKPLLRGGEIHFEAGCEFKFDYLLTYTAGAKYDAKCTWTPADGIACASGGSEGSPGLLQASQAGAVSPIVRDYARFGKYSAFRAQPRARPASPRIPLSVEETTLVSNLFPGASPEILAAGSGRLLLWAAQDPGKQTLQSTDIAWSWFDGTSWSAPALATNDTRAEFSPVAGVDGNGKVVAAWLRIKDVNFTTTIATASDLPLFYKRLEVVSAVFDPGPKTWGPVTALTDDTAYDSDVRISADSSGNLMLTWLSNADGQFQSSTGSPSSLMFSTWSGSAWSVPASIATSLAGVHAYAAARNGSNAFVILSRDPNPAVSNDGVLDLYTWNGTSWSGASTFASGGGENRLPEAAYDGSGAGHVVWVRGTDLVHATLASPTPSVVRAGSNSLSFYDPRLIVNSAGNLTLLRQDSSLSGPGNLFATIYDAVALAWSEDRQLTEDASQAHSLSAFYGDDGAVHAAYLATQISRVTHTVVIGGESVDINNIPQDGQTDLIVLDHSLIVDIAVADSELTAVPARPVPGGGATASLLVHNAGDFATDSFAVKLYAGDPTAGGALLGTQTVTGPFAAGDTRTVNFPAFSMPSGAPVDLVAVADADGAITEFSETNNRATIYLATNAAPEARISASVLSGPVPLSVNFDASASFDADGDAMTYGWAFADGSPSAAGASVGHIFNTPGRYTVTLAVTDARGAVGTAQVIIDAGACGSPPAPPVAGNNGPVCAGGTLGLTAAGPGGASYFWSGPNGFTSTSQSPQISSATAAASGTYSVVVTVAGCASAAATTTAVVNPAPSASVSAGTAVCANRKANFASVPTAGAGATYAWSITNGTITGGAGTSTVTFTAGPSGLVHLAVTVTSGGGCGQQSGQIDVPIVSCAAEPEGLLVDPAPDQSDGNGILEPGETVFLRPSWKNLTGGPLSLTATASGAAGPPGAVYYFNDPAADYGSIASGATADCSTATGNCYEFTVSHPQARPSTHWDATMTETTSTGDPPVTRVLHVGDSFTDVPRSHVFYQFAERVLHNGVTTGCTPTTYCPDATVFRLQMAVFIARAQAGGDANIPVSGSAQGNPYNCVSGGQSQFTDIAPDNPFCRHVHYIFSTGVTTGCITTPPRQYCPGDNVTRGQMALFIARAVAGSDANVPQTYGPDPVTGRSYSCNPASPNLHFTDVTTSDIFCRHTHYLWAKDVIAGFPDGSYGPSLLVTRGAMAKFLANGFKLTLYGP